MPGFKFIDFVNSVTPALVLNILLYGSFFILNFYIELSSIENLFVLLAVILMAVLSYLFLTIFIPLQGIASERTKIKQNSLFYFKKLFNVIYK